MRAKAYIEQDKKTDRQQIIVTEIPYQVNKARLIENIAELVKNKKIEGISEMRDESDKDGMRIVIDIKRGEVPEVLLNNLYSQTQMQSSFGMNMVALSSKQPKLFNLKEILEAFILHRKEVITRRTTYKLRKARERAHVLEGLAIALSNTDKMLSCIKASGTTQEAKKVLLNNSWDSILVSSMLKGIDRELYRIDGRYGFDGKIYLLSQSQVDSILELRLNRLTRLEKDKILSEFRELITEIEELILILKDAKRLLKVVCEELEEVRNLFGDVRRSEIVSSQSNFSYEDLITEEDMVVTLSYDGYIKGQPLSDYNAQKRGGRGKLSTQIKSKDFVYKLSISSTHSTMLCFSSLGKVYWTKVYDFPHAGRLAKGKPINNILPLKNGEKITAMLAVNEYVEGNYILMVTKQGVIKKVNLESFSRPRKGGIYAINLNEHDKLLHVELTNGNKEIMMFSDAGKSIRFSEQDVRSMGRTARGVRGMRIQDDQNIVALIVTEVDKGIVLTATKNGYGKRTLVKHYRKTSRGSQGVISILTSKRNGCVVSANLVEEKDNLMLMTDQGTLIRTYASEVRKTGRSAQGVKLMNLKKDEKLVSVQVVETLDQLD
jgi:DNA gyrase subunit A